jgi:hypothetical protein
MEGEPVDRRGLLRDMFRQASKMVVPAIPSLNLPTPATEPASRSRLPTRTASSEELRDAAVQLGLKARLDELERLSRRSLRLAVAADGGSDAVSFGGAGLMDEGTEWPEWLGRPLTLLAQVDTGEPLGRLMFFYDAVGRPNGCLAAHRGSARVLRALGPSLSSREGPAMPATAVAGVMSAELVLPRAFSEQVGTLELSVAERAAWQSLREELARLQGSTLADQPAAGFAAVHRVFGYPDHSSGEMQMTCELASAGEDVIEGRALLHPRAAELEQRSGRWELLAQLSWDAKLSWPWAAQRIYFWVDRAEMSRGELAEVWAIAR